MVPVWVTTGRPVSWLRAPLALPSQSQTSGTLSESQARYSRGGGAGIGQWPTGFPFHAALSGRAPSPYLCQVPLVSSIARPRICRMTRPPLLR